jgi:hypothetical protein
MRYYQLILVMIREINLFSIVILLSISASLAMDFKPLSDSERLQAIGSTIGLPEPLRKALNSGADFEPIPIPKRRPG